MTNRKGLGKGTGKGYKNIMGTDSSVHSQSAKGIKQPQKTGLFSNLTKKGLEKFNKIRKEQKETQDQNKFELLKDLKHPLQSKLTKQKERVDTLEKHYNESETEELLKKLKSERKELRQIQEEITNIKLQDLSDNELENLAIRYTDDSFFGFGDSNPYKKELLRRIEFRKTLQEEIKQTKNKPKEKGLFEDLI